MARFDGSVAWHPARFLHPSGDLNGDSRIEYGRVWFAVLRAIRADEELTSHDGKGLSGDRDRPCRCWAMACLALRVAANHVAAPRKRHGG